MLKFFAKKPDQKIDLAAFKIKFFANSHHEWMNQAPFVKRLFSSFLETLPENTIKFMMKNEVLFVRTNGHMSFSVQPNQNVIVIMPHLFNLLNSYACDHGLMILAHELGHLFYEHGKTAIDPLEAQVAADQYAIGLGYATELESFLEEMPESIEKRVRLAYVTSFLIKQDYENN